MHYVTIPVTAYQQNCTLLICTRSRRAAVVDPGGDIALILRALAEQGVTLESILLTHGHFDHIGGVTELAQKLNVPIIGPQQEDEFWIASLTAQCEMFGFPPAQPFTPTRWLNDGDSVQVGEETLQVLHCPGHTPGHVVFFHAGDRMALVGDVLFQGSVGRTDFPKGDHAALIASIKHKLFPLGLDVEFIPGHGPNSTFGEEMRSNPFLRS